MKHYYYAENDQQFGPFTVDELKSKRLKKSTLVWREGMVSWVSANEIDELKDIIISEPPPLPKNKTPKKNEKEIISIKQPKPSKISDKYDSSYEKEIDATITGIIILIVPIVLRVTGIFTFDTVESYNQARGILAIISIALRVIVTIWVVNIATRQNRNSKGWGWFAFFVPSIALIIIGLLDKLKLKIELDGNMSSSEHLKALLKKANSLFSHNRYPESIEILNKAIEMDNENFDCIKLRGIANYNIKNYEKAKTDFETLIKNNMFHSDANFYLGNIALEEKNRELAISYWLKAYEYKNNKAKIKLDNFHTFTGNYLLENTQANRKVNRTNDYIHLKNCIYKGGLPLIDQKENLGSLKSDIYGYDLGVNIELKKIFKSYHLVISYYEIKNIVFKELDSLFELHLIDQNILTFKCGKNNDCVIFIKELCEKHKESTGITSEASYSSNG